MPCKLNLLPCARAPIPVPAKAHFASFLDVPTSSWIFRRMQSFGYSKTVYRIDRVSKFVPPLSPVSHSNRLWRQVRHAALRASVSYLTSSDQHQIAQSLSLMYPMLDTLPSLPHAHLPKFLITLTPLTTSHPQLFQPHLQVLLSFLPALIIPSADSGPTPTVARPFPGTQSFTFPPTPNGGLPDDDELDEEAEEVRKAALEFMISLSEAKPAMVRRVDGWVSAIVRGCLGGMGELRDDELSTWLDADVRGYSIPQTYIPLCLRIALTFLLSQPADDPTDDMYPHVYEQALDRLACAVGGKAVLPAAFQHIPGMLASHDWKLRHAGLMAIASVAEGTSKVIILLTHAPGCVLQVTEGYG